MGLNRSGITPSFRVTARVVNLDLALCRGSTTSAPADGYAILNPILPWFAKDHFGVCKARHDRHPLVHACITSALPHMSSRYSPGATNVTPLDKDLPRQHSIFFPKFETAVLKIAHKYPTASHIGQRLLDELRALSHTATIAAITASSHSNHDDPPK